MERPGFRLPCPLRSHHGSAPLRINGYEACRRIRTQFQGRRPAIVALTGWSQEQDREQSLEAGFDAHLVKPVCFDALMALLVTLMPA